VFVVDGQKGKFAGYRMNTRHFHDKYRCFRFSFLIFPTSTQKEQKDWKMAEEKMKDLPTNNDQLVEGEIEEEEEEEDGGGEFDAPHMFRSAVKVLYCGVCGVPPEYCEFNGPRAFSNCRSWLKRFHHTAYQVLGYQKLDEEEEEAKKKNKNAPKPQRIDLPPHSRFQPWAHIYAFHRISAGYLNTKEVLSVRGKIKLHGTNAAVNVHFEAPKNRIETFAQSRNRFVVKDNENYGFSSFVKTNTLFFSSILTTLRNSSEEASGHGEWIRTMTVFGEWCGKGINKGASICTLERKIFAVFSIQLNSDLTIYDPEIILQLLQLSSIPLPKVRQSFLLLLLLLSHFLIRY
jgi:hypothetical protein